VQLSDGELAVVTRPNSRYADRPFVRRVEWRDSIPELAPEEIDLSALAAAGQQLSWAIEKTLDPKKEGLDVCSLLGGNPFCTE
jgi:hypothetical protein